MASASPAGALIAEHLGRGGPSPASELARELPSFHAKRLMRAALELAPPNALVNLALASAPMRRLAERIYFHRRGGGSVDFDAYRAWLENEIGAHCRPSQTVADQRPRN